MIIINLMIQRQALQERFVIVETTMRQCAAFAAILNTKANNSWNVIENALSAKRRRSRRLLTGPPGAILIEEISFYSIEVPGQTSNANRMRIARGQWLTA